MNINHFSIYLKRNMECTVILPSDMKNDEKLPVLWLYHGSSGDNTVWLYHSPITEYVDEGRFCLLYTSPSPQDGATSRMPSSA